MLYETLSVKSHDFAVRIIRMYQHLAKQQLNYGLGDQVLRSGTSIGANISEAVFSQSLADSISKLMIALKEANESRYWIDLLGETDYITKEQSDSMIADCEEIIKLLVATVKTLKNKHA